MPLLPDAGTLLLAGIVVFYLVDCAVLAYADERGRDAFTFEPIASAYLEVADGFVIRTPYSRTAIAELRALPWARWDPALKAWRVPFRSFGELQKRWPAIEAAARRAEPEERRKRAESRKAAPEHADRRAEAAEHRRNRYPVPEDADCGGAHVRGRYR